jgi:hypothetical protein
MQKGTRLHDQRRAAAPTNSGTTPGFLLFLMMALSIAALEILDRSNPLRWLEYVVPIFAVSLAVLLKNIRLFPSIFLLAVFLLVFSLSTVSNLGEVNAFFVTRDLIIYLLILAMFFVRLSITTTQVFLSLCLTFILVFVFSIYQTQLAVSLTYDAEVVRGESTASIVYGALVIFFLINRKFLFAIASLLFAIFTFKRTSYIYLVAAGLYWMMVETAVMLLGNRYRAILAMAAALVLFLVCFVFSFYLIDALQYIQETFFPTVPLQEFTTGRSVLFLLIMQIYDNLDWVRLLFGHGPGFVEQLSHEKLRIDLAHNEFHHHLIDYGLFGIVFFALLVLSLIWIRVKYYPIVFYLVLVCLTDNPIYVFVISIPIIAIFTFDVKVSGKAFFLGPFIRDSGKPLSAR